MDHRPQSPPIEIEGAATGRKTTSRKRKAAAEEESQAAEEDQSTAGNLPMALSETSSADWITTLSNSAITRERCIETILGPVKSTLDGSPKPYCGLSFRNRVPQIYRIRFGQWPAERRE